MLLIALVLVLVWPPVGAWPLLALLVDNQVEALLFRRRR